MHSQADAPAPAAGANGWHDAGVQARKQWGRVHARLAEAGVPDAMSWMPRAACSDRDAALWFADGDTTEGAAAQERARGVCGFCPVRQRCLATALARPENHGIWGGLTPKERRKLRDRQRSN